MTAIWLNMAPFSLCPNAKPNTLPRDLEGCLKSVFSRTPCREGSYKYWLTLCYFCRLLLGSDSEQKRENLTGQGHLHSIVKYSFHPFTLIIIIAIEPAKFIVIDRFLVLKVIFNPGCFFSKVRCKRFQVDEICSPETYSAQELKVGCQSLLFGCGIIVVNRVSGDPSVFVSPPERCLLCLVKPAHPRAPPS